MVGEKIGIGSSLAAVKDEEGRLATAINLENNLVIPKQAKKDKKLLSWIKNNTR